MNNFSNLIGVEYQIARIYNNLFNIECTVNTSNISDLYSLFIVLEKELESLLIKEEEIILNLSKEDVNHINMLLSLNVNIITSGRKDLFSNLIKDRIAYRINNNNPIYDNIDIALVVKNLISDDFDNYYLSFIDEWSHNEKNKLIRNFLFLKKYQYMFMLSRRLEKRKIKDNFSTENSIYTESLFMSQLYNFDNELYNSYCNQYGISKITFSLTKLSKLLDIYDSGNIDMERNKFETLYKLYIYTLRSGFLLLTDDVREETIESMKEEDSFLEEDISNIFKEDFTSILNKDRERHMTLSIK